MNMRSRDSSPLLVLLSLTLLACSLFRTSLAEIKKCIVCTTMTSVDHRFTILQNLTLNSAEKVPKCSHHLKAVNCPTAHVIVDVDEPETTPSQIVNTTTDNTTALTTTDTPMPKTPVPEVVELAVYDACFKMIANAVTTKGEKVSNVMKGCWPVPRRKATRRFGRECRGDFLDDFYDDEQEEEKRKEGCYLCMRDNHPKDIHYACNGAKKFGGGRALAFAPFLVVIRCIPVFL